MIKKILYLTFYFEPDLCACSFRNTPLAYELARQAKSKSVSIDVLTTLPHRYSTYTQEAQELEFQDNLKIHRVQIPAHKSGIKDQIKSFYSYYRQVKKLVRNNKYDLVYASSSRLFTAYLGYRVAKEKNIPLYLDIRDLFIDTLSDILSNFFKSVLIPVLKIIEKKTFEYATHINLISGGFESYFKKFKHNNYSFFTNGIDPVFIESQALYKPINKNGETKLIIYAGNIGEGQGLHKIIPQAAKKLGDNYKFKIIGDGGAKKKLIEELKQQKVDNVELLPPMSRQSLSTEYNKADFLFIHLNDYKAFEKVMPSKIFELGVFSKPLLAGVSGFSKKFINDNIKGSILFYPCNSEELVEKVKTFKADQPIDRTSFIEEFRRDEINRKMSISILKYI